MCGIVAVVTKNEKNYEYDLGDLFKIAHYNKHRGNEDGFGIISKSDNLFSRNSLLHLDEIMENKLIVSKAVKKKRKISGKRLLRELEIFRNIMGFSTQFGILHHRQASHGSINLENTHPFSISKGIKYLHNGSVWGTDMLKNYLELNTDLTFKTDLDSEVLGVLIEEFLKMGKYSDSTFNNVKRYIDKMTPYGYGVIIRVDILTESIFIIKNENRELYLVEQNGAYILMSEIPHFIKSYEKIIKLNFGTFKLDKNGFEILNETEKMCEDITKKYESLNDFKPREGPCDFCNNEKLIYDVESFEADNIMICGNCYLQDNIGKIKVIEEDIDGNETKTELILNPPYTLLKTKHQDVIKVVSQTPNVVDAKINNNLNKKLTEDEIKKIGENFNIGKLNSNNLAGWGDQNGIDRNNKWEKDWNKTSK